MPDIHEAERRSVTRRAFLATVTACAGGAALGGCHAWAQSATRRAHQSATSRPKNIVVVYADDLGYGDLSCYGSQTIHTPNIDRLASDGVKLTSFYSPASICTPARAALMTGSYPYRTGLYWVLPPGADAGLSPEEVTFAEVLRDRGYATGYFGKWHLGERPEFLPTRQGWDRFEGILGSNNYTVSYNPKYPPLDVYQNEKVVESEPVQDAFTQRFTRGAIDFMRAHRDEPFCVFVSQPMPHVPLAASAAFRGRSRGGLYGDAVEELDWGVGELITAIDELGLRDSTLLIFTSDNGPWTEQKEAGGSSGPLRGGKFSSFEGGFRVPFVARAPGRIPAGLVSDEIATGLDLMPTFAALAGESPPEDRVIDGHDIMPLLSGAGSSPRGRFFYTFGDNVEAVREGRWKYRHVTKQRRKADPPPGDPQLYDLETDLGESRNVIAEHPEVAARLEDAISRFAADLAGSSRATRTRGR